MTINDVLTSQDYIDINYAITHIKDIDIRLSVLEQLGYKKFIKIVKEDRGLGIVTKNKKGEIVVQVTNKFKGLNIAYGVVIEDNQNCRHNFNRKIYSQK